MYAELALPVAVDRTFTYLLPPELEPYAVPGVRAVVPFGGKVLTGVIVGLPDSTDVQGLRPVRDILDPEPALSSVLLELCRWLAAYYMAPPGEVVRAALPQGFAARSRRLVRLLSGDPAPRIAELEARSPQRARILRIHARTSKQSSSRTGTMVPALSSTPLSRKLGRAAARPDKSLTEVEFGGLQQSRPRAGQGKMRILARSQRATTIGPARARTSGKVELRPVKRHTWIPIAGALVRTGAFFLERQLPFTRISSIEQSRKRENKEP